MKHSIDKFFRRFVRSVPPLSHRRLLMVPLDLADGLIGKIIGAGPNMPPNRMRIRIGAGNRVVCNHLVHRAHAVPFWMSLLNKQTIDLKSDILDLGCGCGRFAYWMTQVHYEGKYTGLDIDAEMIDWCKGHFDPRFDFHLLSDHSKIYNPAGSRDPGAWPVDDDSKDFVFSMSVLTHLLQADVERVLAESFRVLRPGGTMRMTVFCLELMGDALGGRWTFQHREGEAYLESKKYPEAAVAYEADYLRKTCKAIGFECIEFEPGPQSFLCARVPAEAVDPSESISQSPKRKMSTL